MYYVVCIRPDFTIIMQTWSTATSVYSERFANFTRVTHQQRHSRLHDCPVNVNTTTAYCFDSGKKTTTKVTIENKSTSAKCIEIFSLLHRQSFSSSVVSRKCRVGFRVQISCSAAVVDKLRHFILEISLHSTPPKVSKLSLSGRSILCRLDFVFYSDLEWPRVTNTLIHE